MHCFKGHQWKNICQFCMHDKAGTHTEVIPIIEIIKYYVLLHSMCGYQCDEAMTKNDTCNFTAVK